VNDVLQNEAMDINGNRIVLNYFCVDLYGVGIDMYTYLTDNIKVKESKEVKNVFATEEETERMLHILCRGCVTPTTLEEIIEDYVKQKECCEQHPFYDG
jgi:hypothetical protein